jgi:hypothetical protein
MDRRIALAALAASALMISGTAGAASYEGEWILNADQSHYPPGVPEIKDHHMTVAKDDGKALQYTDNFVIAGQENHVTFDGTYGGKPYVMTGNGQTMHVWHTKTGFRDKWTDPKGSSGTDVCVFTADGNTMNCTARFKGPGAAKEMVAHEVWNRKIS